MEDVIIRQAKNKDIPEIKYGLEPDPSATDLDLEDIEKTTRLTSSSFRTDPGNAM